MQGSQILCIVIFLIFFIATVLSYTSMFLGYYDNVSFESCLKDVSVNATCKYGEPLHVISLILSIGILCLFAVYLFTECNRESFKCFNVPIIVVMALVFLCSTVSVILINDFEMLENNNNPRDGFYLYAASSSLYALSFVMALVYMFTKIK